MINHVWWCTLDNSFLHLQNPNLLSHVTFELHSRTKYIDAVDHCLQVCRWATIWFDYFNSTLCCDFIQVHGSDIYIKHAIELEQCLMEGAYDKVLNSEHNLPASEYYAYFIDQLASTVR